VRTLIFGHILVLDKYLNFGAKERNVIGVHGMWRQHLCVVVVERTQRNDQECSFKNVPWSKSNRPNPMDVYYGYNIIVLYSIASLVSIIVYGRKLRGKIQDNHQYRPLLSC
jgi:hypothetical protein